MFNCCCSKKDTSEEAILGAMMILKRMVSLTVKIIVAIVIVCLAYFLVKRILLKENAKVLGKIYATPVQKVRNSEQIASEAKFGAISKRKRPPVDCSLLIDDDPKERLKAVKFQDANPKKAILESEYIAKTQNCHNFTTENDYYVSSPLPEEEDFPLAFSILIYKNIEQFERLLRAIYRPQNIYCVHVDSKSSSTLQLAVESISRCLENVFVLENRVEVIWGSYSVLKADILCMEALLKYKKWKYFINLTGQEFPLKTNLELVQILKSVNGSNLVEAIIKRTNPDRFKGRPPPPINVTVYKGSVHAVVRREFAEYAITNQTSRTYLNWLKLIGVPDEYFFSTLNHNPQLNIPGSYLGIRARNESYNYPFINRYKVWSDHGLPCGGKYVRTICILGVGDLPRLATSKFLFANKFHLRYQPLALDCLEELIYNRTLAELHGRRSIDLSFYRDLQVTKNHI